jgi:hypothetical protein
MIVKRFKARLCAKGYSQRYGIDYFETYAPVVKFKSVRILVALAEKSNLDAYRSMYQLYATYIPFKVNFKIIAIHIQGQLR